MSDEHPGQRPFQLYLRTPSVTPFIDLLAKEAELHPERYALPEGYVPPPPSCDAIYSFGEPCDGGEDASCNRVPGHRGMHRGSIRDATVIWPQDCHHEEE
jgi:hypothetical protein